MSTVTSEHVQVDGLNLHYLSAGSGPAVLLLHGWPTSSLLWRATMPAIAKKNRVIALDLPGFGASDKPLAASYSFRFYERILNGLLEELELEDVGLAVHDLGGPVGLYWGLRNQAKVRKLALLNTLAYPRVTWALAAFVVATYTPGLRTLLTSQWGLAKALKLGVADPSRLSDETIRGYQQPFTSKAARRVLLKTGHSLHPGGIREIAKRLPSFQGPVRVIYGARDRILPDVEKTMSQVQRDLPQTELTRFADCGHFLQEERGAEVGELLAEFFAD